MQGKQLALLSKLEQLGQECNSLRTDLGSALHEREGMSLVLTELEQKCSQLQQQLMIEQVRMLRDLLYLHNMYCINKSMTGKIYDGLGNELVWRYLKSGQGYI